MNVVRPPLVDTHAHLQDSSFAPDLEAVVDRAIETGLRAIVCVGYDLQSSRQAVELSERHPAIFAGVGIHPNSASQAAERDWDEIRSLARGPRVVGIGETGLDNYRHFTPPALQERWFGRHMALAAELRLPVIVHNRQANERTCDMLREWVGDLNGTSSPGVMHCFAGDLTTLETCLEIGFVISLAGPVTYKNAEALRQVARAVPLDRLVVETDCPYLAPQPRRGERNEPAFVEHTLRRLAEVRGERFAALAERTTRTAEALFNLPILTIEGARVR